MSDVAACRELMLEFAEATGLTGSQPPRRYLWTDAFATCNFLGLHRALGERRFLDLAVSLVDQVHHVLGRHRPDDARTGWISGLPDEEAERRPTAGGLRIGKPLPERLPSEPLDAALEWDRDGQYFHYLTQWMHALRRVAEETADGRHHRWAVELAREAQARFTVASRPGQGPQHVVWKMSIDLSRPLVPSMGQHDPLDALVTYLDLRRTAQPLDHGALDACIAEAEATCMGKRWATDDPLGIGGLLVDASRLARIVNEGEEDRAPLLHELLEESHVSLRAFDRSALLRLPPSRRLPFRELGLAIGLHAVERLRPALSRDRAALTSLDALTAWVPLAPQLEAAWSDPRARQGANWMEHADINAVTLATSLHPDGFLGT